MSKTLRQWISVLLVSAALSAVLLYLHVPAALLLGPMAAGIWQSLRHSTIQVPRSFFIGVQAIIGCMIAQTLNASIFSVLLTTWPIILAVLFATLAVSALCGWLLVRYSALPGVTGAWGSSPGGASAMVAMAQDYGADVRLVAFMQYLRVLFVAGAAALIVRLNLGEEAQMVTQDIVWFPALNGHFLATLVLIVIAGTVGHLSRFPSGVMLFPMLLGAGLQSSGWMTIELPEWLLALAYMAIGWSVGLKFNRAICVLALKSLPQMVASIGLMMAACALMAFALMTFLGLDFLTAFLATSPGGLDTIAIIAVGSHANMSFIMALQTLRLFSIVLMGPMIARFISRHAVRAEAT